MLRNGRGNHAHPALNPTQPRSSVYCFGVEWFFFFLNIAYCAMWWITQTAAFSSWLPHVNEKHMLYEFEIENGYIVVFPCVTAPRSLNKYCLFCCKVLPNVCFSFWCLGKPFHWLALFNRMFPLWVFLNEAFKSGIIIVVHNWVKM